MALLTQTEERRTGGEGKKKVKKNAIYTFDSFPAGKHIIALPLGGVGSGLVAVVVVGGVCVRP